MDYRRQKILEAIVEAFIKNASPVGSKHLSEAYDFKVSPATIRNEMSALEREGYITQPHTSAGRVPTNLAYRKLVDAMREEKTLLKRVHDDMMQVRQEHFLKKTKQKLYDVVSILSGVTENVGFVTLPDKRGFFYMGISHMLKKPEFISQPERTTRVVEILENDLTNLLASLDLTEEGSIYIGEENILPEFQSCSLLAIPYSHQRFSGVMGILGSTRMDYAYNLAALKVALQMLDE